MMQDRSEKTDQLSKAIFDMHKRHGCVIEKNAKGNRGSYANLPQILQTIHDWCNEFGLDLVQPECVVDGKQAIKSVITHVSSDQWRSSISLLTYPVNPQNADQAYGGSSTYHRRYSAMSLLGLFASDDPADHDGWKNEGEQAVEEAPRQQAFAPKPTGDKTQYISEKQCGLFNMLGAKAPQKRDMYIKKYGSVQTIPWKDFNGIVEDLKGQPAPIREKIEEIFGEELEEVF